jgi:Predicted transcriptional regulators
MRRGKQCFIVENQSNDKMSKKNQHELSINCNFSYICVMNKSFGQHLKELRRSANVSQRDLADKAGVDYTYISKVENDRLPPPSAETIEKISEILGADSTDLLSYAKKIPTDLRETLTNNSDAMKFLSEASGMNLSKEEWTRLRQNLKNLR